MCKYISREISFIDFNKRVLSMANNENLSIGDRLNYIKICTSNIDEFISTRLSKALKAMKKTPKRILRNEITAEEEYLQITKYLTSHYKDIEDIYTKIIDSSSINIKNIFELHEEDLRHLEKYFVNNVLPVIVPYKISNSVSAPFIENGKIGIFAISSNDESLVIPIPSFLDRFIPIKGAKNDFVKVEDLIVKFINILNISLKESLAFRPLKDLSFKSKPLLDNYIEDLKLKLNKRKHGEYILIEVTPGSSELLKRFTTDTNVKNNTIILNDIDTINKLSVLELAKDITKETKPYYIKKDIHSIIQNEDFVIQHPYKSPKYIMDFLKQGVDDPSTVSIKQTVYRVSKDSPLMHLLLKAISKGIDVTVVFEITAQFDEANNIFWANKILNAGGNVVYGVEGKKVHAKVMLITKRENKKFKNYCHIATCNYNEINSEFFSDISLFTTNKEIGIDISRLFVSITSNTPQDFRYIISGPHKTKLAIIEKINNEIKAALEGKEACIKAKMNALEDKDIIDKLYEASLSGVKVDLIVRGICCLRTNKDYSKNITVKSILGEFLEHSRIYYFENDKHKLYLGTADLMTRNLEGRFEILTPLLNNNTKLKVLDIFSMYLGNCNSYELNDNVYEYKGGEYNVHEYFKSKRTVF